MKNSEGTFSEKYCLFKYHENNCQLDSSHTHTQVSARGLRALGANGSVSMSMLAASGIVAVVYYLFIF